MKAIWKALKIVVAGYIGFLWDLKYYSYIDSYFFWSDVKNYLLYYLNDEAAEAVASLIQEMLPSFCVGCLVYLVHCLLKAIGWYYHSK